MTDHVRSRPDSVPKFLGSRYVQREYGGKPCPICGNAMVLGSDHHPTKDHVVPKSRGGTLDSCQIICNRCNQEKGDQYGGDSQ